MRVLLVTPDFPPGSGGIQRLLGRLATNLDVRSLTVLTLGTDDPGREDHDLSLPHGVKVVRVRTPKIFGHRLRVILFNSAAVIFGLTRSRRFDIVVVGHIVASPAARALRRLTRIPYMVILHAQEIPNRPRLARKAVESSAATIAVSSHTRDEAIRHGAPEDRIHVVNPGVDPPRPTGVRDRLATGSRPTIATVARMVDRYKGHDVMIEALAEIRKDVPDVHWVVAGDGPLRAEYEQRVKDCGLERNVTFAGRVGDRERDRLLAGSDIFAMPSRVPEGGGGEGFGLVYLEAQAFGLPVVAGAEGGALDAVRHGETGLLIDPRDSRALAAALSELLVDEPRRLRMARAARDFAAERSWPRFADEVREHAITAASRGDRAEAGRLRAGSRGPLILAVSHTGAYGGAERSLITQLNRDSRSSGIRAILSTPPGPLAEQARRSGLSTVEGPGFERSFAVAPWRLPGAALELLSSGRRLADIARQFDPDLIHANSPRAGLIGCVARLFGAPPLVTHVRDVLPESTVARVTRTAVRTGSAAIVANSRHTARSFDPVISRVVYNPLDTLITDVPDSWELAAFAARHGIEPNEPLLSVIGQITPWKGQALAIETLVEVRRTEPSARLAIAGSVKFSDGARFDNLGYADGLRLDAARHGVGDAVVYTGELDDVRLLLALSDIVLMPSWEEPFGRAAAEAMAAGRAVIATSVGGPSEFIEHGVNGMLADPHRPGEWLECVNRLIADTELRRQVGRRAREDVTRRFVLHGPETSMLGVYADVSSNVAGAAA